MKRLHAAGIVAVALALCFGTGMWAERWFADRHLVAEPCSVRTWQPSAGFVDIALDSRDCLPRGRLRTFEGEWDDFAYGGGFRQTSDKPDQVFDFIADGMAKAQIQWLANRKSRPMEFSGRRYHVRFIGWKAHRKTPVVDGLTDVIILERVIESSLVPNRIT